MPILVKCSNPDCGQALRVKDDLAGKKARCPKCQETLTIPALPKVPARAKTTPTNPVPTIRQPKRRADEDEAPRKQSLKPAPKDDDTAERLPAKKAAKKTKPARDDVPDTLWEDCDLLRHDALMSQVKFSLWGSQFMLYNPATDEEVGLAAEKLPAWKGILRPVRLGPVSFRDWMSVDIEVRESHDGPVLFTIRKLASPMPWQLSSTIQILDFRKRLIGYFKTKLFSFTGGFWVYDADDEKVAELRGKLSLSSRHLDFVSAEGHELGCITSVKKGGIWSTPGLAIALSDQARDDLKTKVLLLAATMAMGLGGAGAKLGLAAGIGLGGDDDEDDEGDDE